MRRLFAALRGEFEVTADAEITLECAPGQLGDETLDELLRLGMNRVSFGVQSFVDAEARAVGRLHTREMCLAEIARMRAAGVEEINVDLIAGLPRQTAASWRESVDVAIESGVPHVSVYMLEVDEDSRLGREMLAAWHEVRSGVGGLGGRDCGVVWGGVRVAGGEWGDAVRDFQLCAEGPCIAAQYEVLAAGAVCGIWAGRAFDAAGLFPWPSGEGAVRWANTDDLERFLEARYEVRGLRYEQDGALVQLTCGAGPEVEWIGMEKGFEEAMFLGLRMNEGVDLEELRAEFGEELVQGAVAALRDVEEAGLVEREGSGCG